MAFEALSQILAICQKESIDFAEAVLREDSKDRLVDREASIRQMTAMWGSMCDASDSYDVSRKSNSGLVGGAGGVMADYVAAGNTLCGDAMGRVIAQRSRWANPMLHETDRRRSDRRSLRRPPGCAHSALP